MEYIINNINETESLAKIIGQVAEAGNVIILSGDLGAGKTTMTKGIALGLDIQQMIKSPTYTIIREYQEGRLPLYHMDIYRIGNEVEDLDLDEYFEGDGLTVVEWGELLEEFLPKDYLKVTIEKVNHSLDERKMIINATGYKSTNFLNRIDEKIGG